MGTNGRILWLGGGFLAGLLSVVLWWGAPGPRAQAQPGPAFPLGQYQLAAFTIPQGPGAYILNTVTGEVFQVVGKNAPEHIGSVSKVEPRR
jgi:hypothetical protein